MTKKIIKKNNKKIIKNFSIFSKKFLLMKNKIFLKKKCKNQNKKIFFNKKNIKLISTKKKYFNLQNKKNSIKSFYSKTTNYDSKKKEKNNLNNQFKINKNNQKIKFFNENNKIVLIKIFKENDLKFNKYNFIPQIFWQEEDNDILSNDEQINRDYKKSIFNLFNTLRKIKNVPEYLNQKLNNKLKFK